MVLLLCGAFMLADAQNPTQNKQGSVIGIKKKDKPETANTNATDATGATITTNSNNSTNATNTTNTTNTVRTYSHSNKGNSATFLTLAGFHFERGMYDWHPRFQYGTYLTNHLAWLLGVGYDMNRVKLETMDLSGNTVKEKLKTRTLSVPLTLRYGIGRDAELVQVHAGVSYNYITSMRLAGEKMDLTGIKRGYFSGHVRVSLIGLLFVEYEYMFNHTVGTDPRPGMFYYGICLDF